MQSSPPATLTRSEEIRGAEGGATPAPRWTWKSNVQSLIQEKGAWTPPATSPRWHYLRSAPGSSRVRWHGGARRAVASALPCCAPPPQKASEAELLLGAFLSLSRARSKCPPQERRQLSSTLEAGAGPTEDWALRATTAPAAGSSAIALPRVATRSAAALESVASAAAVHAAAALAIGSLRAP